MLGGIVVLANFADYQAFGPLYLYLLAAGTFSLMNPPLREYQAARVLLYRFTGGVFIILSLLGGLRYSTVYILHVAQDAEWAQALIAGGTTPFQELILPIAITAVVLKVFQIVIFSNAINTA